jgi:predicted  nucleic acid-binding Zn-ribbon protein
MDTQTESGNRPGTVEERLRSLGSRIDDLVQQTTEKRGTLRDHLERRVRELAEAIDDDIDRLEAKVDVVGARLEQDAARTFEDLEGAVEREFSAWRRRLEHLQVQASLGRLELRDEVERSRERLEHVQKTISDRLDWLRKVHEEPWPGLRDEIRQSMEELAEEIP